MMNHLSEEVIAEILQFLPHLDRLVTATKISRHFYGASKKYNTKFDVDDVENIQYDYITNAINSWPNLASLLLNSTYLTLDNPIKLTNLKELNFNSSEYEPDAIYQLISNNSRLNNLELTSVILYSKLGDLKCPEVEILSFAATMVDETEENQYNYVLKDMFPNLIELDLSFSCCLELFLFDGSELRTLNMISTEVQDDLIHKILMTCPKLQTLDIGSSLCLENTNFESESIERIVATRSTLVRINISKCPNLKFLDISGCNRLTCFGDIATENIIEIKLSQTPFEEYEISHMCPRGTKIIKESRNKFKYGF